MKKLISILLVVLLLTSGATAFARNEENKTETVKTYYDVGVTVTFPEEYSELIGNIYVDNYGLVSNSPEICIMEYSYSSLPGDEYETVLDKLINGTATSDEEDAFWDAWGFLAFVYSVKDGGFDDLLSVLNHPEEYDEQYSTELASVDNYHFFIYMNDEKEYVESLDEEHAEDYAKAREVLLNAYRSAEYYVPQDPMVAMVGSTLSFETVDLEGNPVTSEDLFSENEITMINVWATWCGPCKGELGELAKIHTRLQEKSCGVIGIVTDGSNAAETATSLISQNGITYPNICESDDMEILDYINAIPTTIFVDKNGTILCESIVGAKVSEYETTVDRLLTELSDADCSAPRLATRISYGCNRKQDMTTDRLPAVKCEQTVSFYIICFPGCIRKWVYTNDRFPFAFSSGHRIPVSRTSFV